MLKLYNDLLKKKEIFKPITKRKVSIYVCGPTVYDQAHIGHARAAIAFDVLRRYFLFKKYKVTYVSNYTDVDDNMIKTANEQDITIYELADELISAYEAAMNELNVLPCDISPRATETIQEIIEFIQLIMKNGYAYESNGSVYFYVDKLEGYETIFPRKFTKKSSQDEIHDQDTMALNEYEDEKKGEKDFALWKKSKPGEPKWEAPWGEGRPGWHIECSSMIRKYMGDLIDIHGGGKDLIFPHHTNEIAQTLAAVGTTLANYWLHNGFVNLKGEKMSKSLKNFTTISEVLKLYDSMVIRFYLTSVNYRSPINYSVEGLEEAKQNFEKIRDFYGFIYHLKTLDTVNDSELFENVKESYNNFKKALDDDINTTKAVSEIYQIMKIINTWIIEKRKDITKRTQSELLKFLDDYSKIFGVILSDNQDLDDFITKSHQPSTKEQEQIMSQLIELLIDIRSTLRKKKMFDVSDKIREKLTEMGIELDDLGEKTIWKFKN
ncbi:MAG: cysteine--tRNA ligase [Candidatus Lokiarchaeota archaeon]|nr:cysteine--tRNA ligase [Candidatus Lokiarchaeota archaeon]